jgi:WD40 repeat protein
MKNLAHSASLESLDKNAPSKTGTKHLEGHTSQIRAICALPKGRLASGASDNTIRLWDVKGCAEVARLEIDASITTLAAIAANRLVAGDDLGRLHWLEVLE